AGIHTAVPPTDEEQTLSLRQGFREVLCQYSALRAEEDDVRRAKACLDLLNPSHDRLWLHDHASASAIWIIVRDVMAVGGKVAQVVDLYLEQTPLLRALHDTRLQRGRKHLWKNGQDVHFHCLIQQACHRIEADFTTLEVDAPYDIPERRNERLMAPVAHHIDIVTAGINDLSDCPEVAPVMGIDGQAFNLKPVIFSCGEGSKPAARDKHLIPSQSFGCLDVLATLQSPQHTLVDRSPLKDGHRLRWRLPLLQEYLLLYQIGQ